MPDVPTTADLICAECRYDLRSLPTDSNCPECGRSIVDSINARPLGLWLATFRRDVTFLLMSMAIAAPGVPWNLWYIYPIIRLDPDSVFRFTHPLIRYLMHLNREAVFHATYALVFFPAIWFITRPKNLPQLNLVRFRRWLLVLTAFQLTLAFVTARMFHTTWPFSNFWADAVVMITYALMPLTDLAILWLLLELLYKSLLLLRRPIPRFVFRAIQWPLIYSYLVIAMIQGAVCLIHIWVDHPPYLKPALLLDRYVVLPAFYMLYAFYYAMLLVVLHCRFRLHRVDGLSIPAGQIGAC